MVADDRLLAGHQQPWYWLCRLGRSLSCLKKYFNFLCHINVSMFRGIYCIRTNSPVAEPHIFGEPCNVCFNHLNSFSKRYHPRPNSRWVAYCHPLGFFSIQDVRRLHKKYEKWHNFPHIWHKVLIFSSNIVFEHTEPDYVINLPFKGTFS